MILVIVWLALVVFCIAGMWMTFTKAQQVSGWGCLIPIYNIWPHDL